MFIHAGISLLRSGPTFVRLRTHANSTLCDSTASSVVHYLCTTYVYRFRVEPRWIERNLPGDANRFIRYVNVRRGYIHLRTPVRRGWRWLDPIGTMIASEALRKDQWQGLSNSYRFEVTFLIGTTIFFNSNSLHFWKHSLSIDQLGNAQFQQRNEMKIRTTRELMSSNREARVSFNDGHVCL